MYLFIKNNRAYLIASIILLVFGAIYEYFSHGIYSIYMYGAFAIPLIFIIISTISDALFKLKLIKLVAYKLLCLTLVLASIVNGIIFIYGTTNSIVNIYLLFIAVAVIDLILEILSINKLNTPIHN